MQHEQRRKRKVAAVSALAVAGLATVALSPIGETVASYADDGFGGGEFNAADLEWRIESSTDGTTWADTDADNPATLSVSNLPVYPGKAAYAPISLRVQEGSGVVGGIVSMSPGTQVDGSTMAGSFRMRAVSRTDSECNSGSFGEGSNFILGSTSEYGTMLSGGARSFSLPAPVDYTEAGAARTVCLEFSLPDSAASDRVNGTTTSVQWTFTARQG